MGNNVQVSENILEAMRQAAQASGEDVNRLFEEAAEKLLAYREVHELAAYGESRARALGRKPSDVARIIRESRQRVR